MENEPVSSNSVELGSIGLMAHDVCGVLAADQPDEKLADKFVSGARASFRPCHMDRHMGMGGRGGGRSLGTS